MSTKSEEKATVLSETNIDKSATDFGKRLNAMPKTKIRLYLPQSELQKYQTLEQSNKEVQWPTETIILNGYRYDIKKGLEVEVPEPIAQIARDAGLC